MILRAALLAVCLAGGAKAQVTAFDAVSAIFAERCVKCHSGVAAPMGLDLTTYANTVSGGWASTVVEAGNADSPLLRRLRGDITPRMPLNGPPFLSEAEIATVTAWVMDGLVEGAPVAAVTLPTRPAPGEPVLWSHVEPIFQRSCIKCHSDNGKLAAPPEGLRLTTLDMVLAGGERLVVLPGNPRMSAIWRHITGTALPRMPYDGPPWLDPDDIRLIEDWIAQGAKDSDGNPAPIPVGAEVRLRGVLTGPSAIDGADFVVDGSTRVDDRPGLGDAAEMRGEVQADGTVRATRLRER
jgi:mono/diheme cytochrome c family protein